MTIQVPLSGTVVVPRDYPLNVPLPGATFTWTPPDVNQYYMSCPAGAMGTRYWTLPITPYGALGGGVYATNVAGIGVMVMNKTTPFPTSASYSSSGAYDYYWGTQNLIYAFVRTGTASSGAVTGGQVPTVQYSFDPSLVVYNASAVGSVSFVAAACQTPDVMVPLGTHKSSEFSGIGSFTSSTSFNVSLNSCPGGMNSIQYRIDPSTAVLNSAQSVVALDASSPTPATGVGVQLLDNGGSAFPLMSWQTFSGYSPTTSGSYSIPLKARYYQTGSTVGPGNANSSMTFTMLYQ